MRRRIAATSLVVTALLVSWSSLCLANCVQGLAVPKAHNCCPDKGQNAPQQQSKQCAQNDLAAEAALKSFDGPGQADFGVLLLTADGGSFASSTQALWLTARTLFRPPDDTLRHRISVIRV